MATTHDQIGHKLEKGMLFLAHKALSYTQAISIHKDNTLHRKSDYIEKCARVQSDYIDKCARVQSERYTHI